MASNKFDAMKRRLSGEAGVHNPGAVAAKIGDNKYGKATMEKAAAKGKPAAKVKDADDDGE